MVGAASYLDGLLEGPVQFLFHFLLQEARGFRLLHAGGRRLEAAVVAGGVAFVHLRSELLVDADDDHTCGGGSQSAERQQTLAWTFEKVCALTAAERSHLGVLRVDLRDVGDPLAQHVHGDLVTVLVLPVGGLVASSLHLRSTVGWRRRRQRQVVDAKKVPEWNSFGCYLL